MRVPLAVFLPLATCAAGAPSPKAAVDSYLKAEAQGDYAAAHALLAPSDQQARPLDVYEAEHLHAGPIWLSVARRSAFKLGKVDKLDTHATVSVQVTHLDMKAVESGLRGVPTDRIETSPDPRAALFAYVDNEVARQPFPTVTESLTYAAVEQDDGWYVWLALDRQQAAIDAVLAARRLPANADEATVRAAWTAVTTLPHDPGGVVEGLQAEAHKQIAAISAFVGPPAP